MAYSTIDKSTAHFNTKLYTGNGSTQSITGVGFQPDWTWIKERNGAVYHQLADAVRGNTKYVTTNVNSAEATETTQITAFDSDGFSLGNKTNTNNNSDTYVSWNWLAGGTTPSQTYTVKVVSDSGNKYRFDDFGTSAVTLDLQEGGTYTFDQSDSSNAGHPLRFSTTSNGSHGGGSEYTTGVTTNGTPGSSGAYTRITVAASAPTLYYYCTQHSGMGGQANTNSTFGSSNFSGSVQSTVSANTTAGFSIVKFNYPSSGNFTFGHGLGVAPRMFILKGYTGTANWQVYHESVGNTKNTQINYTNASSSAANWWGSTSPTTTVCTVGSDLIETGQTAIAYCFAEKTGYSKFETYTGNGNADGTFVYTGFAPSFVMTKRSDSTSDWLICDNKRPGYNPINKKLFPNLDQAEDSYDSFDFVSNGFKIRSSGTGHNASGGTFLYMAFGQTIVGSNDVTVTAR